MSFLALGAVTARRGKRVDNGDGVARQDPQPHPAKHRKKNRKTKPKTDSLAAENARLKDIQDRMQAAGL
jgi:hypothetical protein